MAAPLSPLNAHRYDPYRAFKFQVLIDGKPVAGFNKMNALKKAIEAVDWRSAGDPTHLRVMPGGTIYEAVSLEQGLTHDPVFQAWANQVNNFEDDSGMSLQNYRKDIVINVLNLQGQVATSYKLYRAWVSEFQALPDMDAGSMNTIAIQTLTVQYESLERDTSVCQPTAT